MRIGTRLATLVAVVALLPGCDKPAETATEKPATAVASEKPAAREAFQRSGEMLTVHVDAMPRQQFLSQLAALTGTVINVEGDNNQAVTVHLEHASLRQVLAVAIADAPYTMALQYTNLQDSFPSSINVMRYQGVAVPQAAQQAEMASAAQPEEPVPAMPLAPAVEENAGPAFSELPPEEQLNHFMAQPSEEQVSIVFDMEPTPEESRLLAALIAKEGLEQEVKLEILDSFSNGEYRDSIEGLRVAVADRDEEVAAKAVEVIGELGSEKDIPELEKISKEHASETVRQAALDAIEFLR